MASSKVLMALFWATFLLLMSSGGVLVSLQSFLSDRLNSTQSDTSMPPRVLTGEIRSIVSTVKKASSDTDLAGQTLSDQKVPDRTPMNSSLKVDAGSTQLSRSQQVAVDLIKTKKISQEPPSNFRASPVLVLYPDEIVIEFPKVIASMKNIKNAISRTLLSNSLVSDQELLKKSKINLRQRPYFYRKVLDQHKQPIRYPKQAFDYADYLIEHHAEEIKDEEGEFIALHIPLVESGLTGPAKSYQAWVKDYADEFDVPPSLVYAVMETESAFNPRAVSRSNAIGLMQLKPEAAGRDVYQYIDAKPGQPSLNELFDSKNNIRMGTAYLGLLKHDYLSNIMDEKIKQMVTISSYNGGLSTVLRLFGHTPEKAVERLNKMKPNQVYRKLRYDHQSDETRRYLDKVLKAETKYRALLNEA